MSRKRLLMASGLVVAAACASVALAQAPPTPPAPAAPAAPAARAFSLIAGGNFLGVYTEEITRENMGRYNLSGEPRGVGVTGVVENSPAAKAGLQKGDVILAYDGEQVASTRKLQRLIEESAPEHTARLTVSRGGGELSLSATLSRGGGVFGPNTNALRIENGQVYRWDGKDWQKQSGEEWQKRSEEWQKQSEEMRKHADELRRQLEKFRAEGGGNFALAFAGGRRIGVTTTQLTDQLGDYFGVGHEGGVLVTSVVENGPAAKAGLKAGDIITEVDGERVRNAGDLSRLVSRRDDGDVTLSVTRDRSRRTLKVTPEKSAAPTTWTFPEGLFTAPGAALALPRGGVGALPLGGLVVRPSTINAPRPRALTAPRIVAPRIVPPQVRPITGLAPARGILMEL